MLKNILITIFTSLLIWSEASTAEIIQIDSSASGIQTSGGLVGSGYGDLSISGSFNLYQTPYSLEGWDLLIFEDIDVLVGDPGFLSPSITSALPDYNAIYNGNIFENSIFCILVVGVICPTDNITGSYDGTNFSMKRNYFSGFADDFSYSIVINGTVSAIPVPAAVWLFGSGLIGLAGFAKRNKE